VKRRTKNKLAFVVFVMVCVVPIVVVGFFSYMVASGKTTRSVAKWLGSQLDLTVELGSLNVVGAMRAAENLKVLDYRGEKSILGAAKVEFRRGQENSELAAEGVRLEIADEATAADVLDGLNKLLRASGLKTVTFNISGLNTEGLLKCSFPEPSGAVEVDGKDISVKFTGKGADEQGVPAALSLTASLRGRSLEFNAELSRAGGPFIAGALKPVGPVAESLVRGFKGNQVVRISHEGRAQAFKEGFVDMSLLGFYRRANLKDSFNSFGDSYITELVVDDKGIRSFDVRVLAKPNPDHRKVFSRRFLYTAHYLLTGDWLVLDRDKDEFHFRELGFDVKFVDGNYVFKGQLSVDGLWILLDASETQIPPVEGAVISPEVLAVRWQDVRKFNQQGWPQESLPRTTGERLQHVTEFALNPPTD